VSEVFENWEKPDEAKMRFRQRVGCVKQVILAIFGAIFFCLFVSGLFGVPQSFLGEWWMRPPRYPNAALHKFREGEVCLMTSPSVYCYEWFYRTDDPVEEVIAYYENLEWRFHEPIQFEWRRGRRFGLNWVAEDNVRILSNICGYQIIVHPAPEGNTEVYILERGAMGDYRASDM